MDNPYEIIKSIFRTEKETEMSPLNKYLFVVNRKANKIQIKNAIEKIYNVKALKINTQNRKGKKRKIRFREGKRSDWKKAIVTLKSGFSIDVKA